jgi:hypothetical protein
MNQNIGQYKKLLSMLEEMDHKKPPVNPTLLQPFQ